MSKSKNLDRICVVVTILAILVTILFMNGESLGLERIIDEDAENYSGNTHFTANDLNGNWDTSRACQISLEGDHGTVKGSGAYFYEGNLVIANPGYYVITGELTDGSIIVEAYDNSKIWILLNGVSVCCSDDACIRINQADKVFLTLAEGTENVLESGDTYSEEALADNTDGVIFAHDDLTINGSGSLTVKGGYEHGIGANDSLVIAGGSISVEAVSDGIHVNDEFCFTGANLTITAGDDAVHSDSQILIADGTIYITKCYEGLEAPSIEMQGGDVTIYPSDDGINANGGS
ncbi:MAG: carbohydrate-binding domain-containing protein, partial [Blautia sp.]|nr:carbohydrate-binding domain-containing protein [Blautia sp.]